MEENEWLPEGTQRLFYNIISRRRAQKGVTQLCSGGFNSKRHQQPQPVPTFVTT